MDWEDIMYPVNEGAKKDNKKDNKAWTAPDAEPESVKRNEDARYTKKATEHAQTTHTGASSGVKNTGPRGVQSAKGRDEAPVSAQGESPYGVNGYELKPLGYSTTEQSEDINGVTVHYFIDATGKKVQNPDDLLDAQIAGATNEHERYALEQEKARRAMQKSVETPSPFSGVTGPKTYDERLDAQKKYDNRIYAYANGMREQIAKQVEENKAQRESAKPLVEAGLSSDLMNYNADTTYKVRLDASGNPVESATNQAIATTDDKGNTVWVDDEGNEYRDSIEVDKATGNAYKVSAQDKMQSHFEQQKSVNVANAQQDRFNAERDEYRATHKAPEKEPQPTDFKNQVEYTQARLWWNEIIESRTAPKRDDIRYSTMSDSEFTQVAKEYIDREKARREKELESIPQYTYLHADNGMGTTVVYGREETEEYKKARQAYNQWLDDMLEAYPDAVTKDVIYTGENPELVSKALASPIKLVAKLTDSEYLNNVYNKVQNNLSIMDTGVEKVAKLPIWVARNFAHLGRNITEIAGSAMGTVGSVVGHTGDWLLPQDTFLGDFSESLSKSFYDVEGFLHGQVDKSRENDARGPIRVGTMNTLADEAESLFWMSLGLATGNPALGEVGMNAMIINGAGEQAYAARMNGSSNAEACMAAAMNAMIWKYTGAKIGTPFTLGSCKLLGIQSADAYAKWVQNEIVSNTKASHLLKRMLAPSMVDRAAAQFGVLLTENGKMQLSQIAQGTFRGAMDMSLASFLCSYIPAIDGETIRDEEGNLVTGFSNVLSNQSKLALKAAEEAAIDGALISLFFAGAGVAKRRYAKHKLEKDIESVDLQLQGVDGTVSTKGSDYLALGQNVDGVFLILGKGNRENTLLCRDSSGGYREIPAGNFDCIKGVKKETFYQKLQESYKVHGATVSESSERYELAKKSAEAQVARRKFFTEYANFSEAERQAVEGKTPSEMLAACDEGVFTEEHADLVHDFITATDNYYKSKSLMKEEVEKEYTDAREVFESEKYRGKSPDGEVVVEAMWNHNGKMEKVKVVSGDYWKANGKVNVRLEDGTTPTADMKDVILTSVVKSSDYLQDVMEQATSRASSLIDGNVSYFLEEGRGHFPILMNGEPVFVTYVGEEIGADSKPYVIVRFENGEVRDISREALNNAYRDYIYSGPTSYVSKGQDGAITIHAMLERVTLDNFRRTSRDIEQIRERNLMDGAVYEVELEGKQATVYVVGKSVDENGEVKYSVRIKDNETNRDLSDDGLQVLDATEMMKLAVKAQEQSTTNKRAMLTASVPRAEDGTPMYHRQPLESTLSLLAQRDATQRVEFITFQRGEAETLLAQLEHDRAEVESSRTSGAVKDLEELAAADEAKAQKLAEIDAQIADAKARLEYWDDIQAENEKQGAVDAYRPTTYEERMAAWQSKTKAQRAQDKAEARVIAAGLKEQADKAKAALSASPTGEMSEKAYLAQLAYDDFCVRNFLYDEGLVENEFTINLSPEQKAVLDSFGKQTGNAIVILPRVEGGRANGLYSGDGVIYVAGDAIGTGRIEGKTLEWIVGHESTHSMESLEGYEQYKSTVMGTFPDLWQSMKDETYGRYYGFLYDNYRSQGYTEEQAIKLVDRTLTDDYVEREVLADITGELFNNPDMLRRFAAGWKKPSEAVLKIIEEKKDTFGKLYEVENAWALMAKAAKDAKATKVVTDTEGTPVVSENTVTGDIAFNSRTEETKTVRIKNKNYSVSELRDMFIDKQVESGKMTKGQGEYIKLEMRRQMERAKAQGADSKQMEIWNNAMVTLDESGKPVFSIIIPDAEYPANIGISLVCKRRRALNEVMRELVSSGLIDQLTQDPLNFVAINQIIKEHGLEVGCDICYVEARRFRTIANSDKFTDTWNTMIESLDKEGVYGREHHNFGENRELDAADARIDKTLLTDAPDDALDFSYLKKVMDENSPKTVLYRQAKFIMEHPEVRKLLTRGDFVDSRGFGNAKENAANQHHNYTKDKATILGLFNSTFGASNPKNSFGDTPYNGEILAKDRFFGRNKTYKLGGIRFQSFDDYVGKNWFDYLQAHADMATRGLPAHSYTKEVLMVKTYGLTGNKINMSAVPDTVEGAPAGLNPDGSYAWHEGYFIEVDRNNQKKIVKSDVQTFPYEDAVAITNAEGYRDNCGIVAIGASDEHIWKLMHDNDIAVVIPYHRSSLNPVVAHAMGGVGRFSDYTNIQNERYGASHGDNAGKALSDADKKKVPSINLLMAPKSAGGKEMGAREAIEYYVRWCEERDILPKFDKFCAKREGDAFDGAEMWTTDENGIRHRDIDNGYYKFIADFKIIAYDAEGKEYDVPQRDVKLRLPDKNSAFGSFAELTDKSVADWQETYDDIEYEMHSHDGKNGIIEDIIERVIPQNGAEMGIDVAALHEKSRLNLLKYKEYIKSANAKQKVGEPVDVDIDGPVDIDNGLQRSISKNNRNTIANWLNKREGMTDEEKEGVMSYIDTLEGSKLQLATGRWYARGVIRIPEDMEKVKQAVEVAGKAKVDPLQYSSPMELIEHHADIKIKEKPINPDDVPTLHRAKELPHGVVVYDVEDSEESRMNMRRIIDTHFGKDCSPWCLLQGDGNGGLTEDSHYRWYEQYNAYPKQVAFRDGRLVSFSANSTSQETWWDKRDDSCIIGIPVGYFDVGDKRKQSHILDRNGDLVPYGKIFRGDRSNGTYEEWHENGQLNERSNWKAGKKDGLSEWWYDNGQMWERKNFKAGKLDGLDEWWYDNGQMRGRSNWKNGKRDGLEEEWDNDGQMRSRLNFKAGKLDGLCETWHDNGQLAERSNWKAGKRDGLHETWWHENGQLRSRSNWKDGEKDGLYEEWHDNGQLAERSNWKNGEEEGLYELWHSNGQMHLRRNFKEGKKDGLYEDWDKNGQLTTRANWKDGKKDGLYERWNRNGQMMKRSNYKDGELDGLYEEWYDNGQPKERSNWKNGKKDGLCEWWDDNGQLIERLTYKDGLRDGLHEAWWYDNGQMIERSNWKNDKRDGLSEEWDEDGQMRSRSNYKDDKLDGLYEEWDENGKLIERANYKNGKVVEDEPAAMVEKANMKQKTGESVDIDFDSDLDLDSDYPDTGVRYSLSKNNRKTIEGWLKKREDLSEAEKTAVMDYIDSLDDAKTQLATGRWYVRGVIRIPEDMEKVKQAVEVAGKAKVDPLQYGSPMELIEHHAGIKIKEKPINPDDVPTLHRAKELPHGVVVYDVEDSEESRMNMRRIIDTHFGKDCSPWCLLQGDGNGNLTPESARHWRHYSAYPKQVAFRDGQLVSFSANNTKQEKWWDKRDDSCTTGIPVGYFDVGDKRKQSHILDHNGDLVPYGKIFRGDTSNGKYEEWYSNGQLERRTNWKDGELDGLSETWHNNGQMKSRSNYKDSKLDGLYEAWLENGQMKERSNWKDGKRDGLHESWYSNGQLWERTNYKDGKRDGLYEWWHEDGQPKERSNWKDAEEDGLYEVWYENGQMKRRSNFKDGKKDGLYETWYEDGQMKSRLTYKDGKREGLYEEWDENGQMKSRSTYKDGELDGLYELWYENGQLRLRETYKDDEREGRRECWDRSGQLRLRGTFKDGKKDGLFETWYGDGQLAERTNYKDDEPDGLCETWHSNGQMQLRGIYKDGKKDGLYEFWHSNGQLAERANFKDGKLVDENGEPAPIQYSAKKLDNEYNEALKDNEPRHLRRLVEQAAKESMVNIATDENGKVLDLWHGTPRFGFTVFTEGKYGNLIYTSTKSNVAGNYGGEDYAPIRAIRKPLREGDSVEDILHNIEQVTGIKREFVTQEEKDAYIAKIEEDAKRVYGKVMKLMDTFDKFPAIDDTEADYIWEAIMWLRDLYETVVYRHENRHTNTETLEYLEAPSRLMEKSRQTIMDYKQNHFDELSKPENKEVMDFLDYLSSYEFFDTSLDIMYDYAKALSGEELVGYDGKHWMTIPELKEIVDRTKTGTYHLYGDLGDNPLIIDCDGRVWTDVKYNGKTARTDTIVVEAREKGHTSVVFKNVYDGGDMADDYVFFSPSQVKSADMVTYDNNGDVIPLSKRFDLSENDIRWSTKSQEQARRANSEYLRLAETFDESKDKGSEKEARIQQLFNEQVLSQADKGIVPILFAREGYTEDIAQLAHDLKGERGVYYTTMAISGVADAVSQKVPENAVIIPMPSHTGKASTETIALANAVKGKVKGSVVVNALEGMERESQHDIKTGVSERHELYTPDEMGMRLVKDLPTGRPVVIVDNIIDNGNTAAAASRATGGGIVAAYAYTGKGSLETIPLKDASPITYDANGNVVPLTERFNVGVNDIRYSVAEDIKPYIHNQRVMSKTNVNKDNVWDIIFGLAQFRGGRAYVNGSTNNHVQGLYDENGKVNTELAKRNLETWKANNSEYYSDLKILMDTAKVTEPARKAIQDTLDALDGEKEWLERTAQGENLSWDYPYGEVYGQDISYSAKVAKSGPFYSKAAKKEAEKIADDKTLVGVHNISSNQLSWALALGGLANPSAAVADFNRSKSYFDKYGDISLLMPPRMVEAKTGRHKGAWNADIYSPNFPSVIAEMSPEESKRFAEDITKSVGEGKEEIASLIIRDVDANLGNNNAYGMEYLFLKENGVDMSKIDEHVHRNYDTRYDKFLRMFNGTADMMEAYRNNPEFKAEFSKFVNKQFNSEMWREFKRSYMQSMTPEQIEEYKANKLKYEHSIWQEYQRSGVEDMLLGPDGFVSDATAEDAFARAMGDYYKIDGSLDAGSTVSNAKMYISEHDMWRAYDDWAMEKLKGYDVKRKLYNGRDYYGRPKYIPFTLENASRIMKKEGLKNADSFFSESMGGARANMAKALKTIASIRRNKAQIDESAFEQIKDELEAEYRTLAKELSDNEGYSWGISEGYYRLQEAMLSNNPKEYVRSNYDLEISDETAQRITDLANELRVMPTGYFEIKFERPVRLEEFVAAVVPDNTSLDLINRLKEHNGLKVYYYNASVEGDRLRVTKEAATENDIRFSVKNTESPERDRNDIRHTLRQEGLPDAIHTPVYDGDMVKFAREMQEYAHTMRVLSEGPVYSAKDGHSAEWRQAASELKDNREAMEILNSKDRTIDDVAADVLRSGGLMWEDYGEGEQRMKGVRSMMGWSEGERRSMFPIFKSKEKGGISFARAGEVVEQACRDENIPYDETDAMAGVNALQNVLSEVGSIADLNAYTDRRRIMSAYEAQRRANEQRDEYYLNTYGMTYDEYQKKNGTPSKKEEKLRTLAWYKTRVDRQRALIEDLQKQITKASKTIQDLRSSNSRNVFKADTTRAELEQLEKHLLAKQQQVDIGDKLIGTARERESRALYERNRVQEQLSELESKYSSTEEALEAVRAALKAQDDVRGMMTAYINQVMESEWMPMVGKRNLGRLMGILKNAKTIESFEDLRAQVDEIVTTSSVRYLQDKVHDLLTLKTVDRNTRGMAIGKAVDANTKAVLDMVTKRSGLSTELPALRGHLEDLQLRSQNLRAELEALKQKRKDVRTDINYTKKQKEGASDADLARLDEMISQKEKEWASLAPEIIKLQTKVHEINNTADHAQLGVDEDRLSVLQVKLDKAAQGTYTWTQYDTNEYEALQIITALSEARAKGNEAVALENEIYKLRKELSEDWNNAKSANQLGNEAFRRSRAIKQATLLSNQNMLAEARRAQGERLANVHDLLKEVVSGGKDKFRAKIVEDLQRQQVLLRNVFADIRSDKVYRTDLGDTVDHSNRNHPAFTAPLYSFEYMVRSLSQNGRTTDSFLYKHFIEGEDGVMAAYDNKVTNMRAQRRRLNDKVIELFGDEVGLFRNMVFGTDEWILLAEQAEKVEKDTGVWKTNPDTDVKEPMQLSKSQAMYLYMVWKQSDGRVKMLQQGFDGDTMKEIESFLGPQYIKLADWLQEEYLPETRARYNERYREMYNVSLADIEHYVPLKINDSARNPEDADLENKKGQNTKLDTKAGSLITRQSNLLPINYLDGAFQIMSEYIEGMEDWYAYVKVRRELDSILGSSYFKNKVDSNYGGDYERFRTAAAIATQSEQLPNANGVQKALSGLNKNIVGVNIAFRLNTALKQLLSSPAYLGYTGDERFLGYLAKYATWKGIPYCIGNLNWCMEHVPSFRERMYVGDLGDNRLSENLKYNNRKVVHTTMEKVEQALTKALGTASEKMNSLNSFGMLPNRMVDGITCSMGIRAIYDYEMYKANRYIKNAKLEGQEKQKALDEAKKKALRLADIFYNSTQQSSHPAFLSEMQKGTDLMSRAFSAYQNSNIAYTRMMANGIRDLSRDAKWNETVELYKRQFMLKGMGEKKAASEARQLAIKTLWEDVKHIFVPIILKVVWNAGGRGLLGFFSDDDKDKKEQLRIETDSAYKARRNSDAAYQIANVLLTPFQGMPANNLLLNLLTAVYGGYSYNFNPVLGLNELEQMSADAIRSYNKYGLFSPELAGKIALHLSRFSGIDIRTFTNIFIGCMGLAEGNTDFDDNWIDWMYILNTPRSGRMEAARNIYGKKDVSPLEYAQVMSYADGFYHKHPELARWLPISGGEVSDSELTKLGAEYAEMHPTVGKGSVKTIQKAEATEKKVDEALQTLDSRMRDAVNKAEVKFIKKVVDEANRIENDTTYSDEYVNEFYDKYQSVIDLYEDIKDWENEKRYIKEDVEDGVMTPEEALIEIDIVNDSIDEVKRLYRKENGKK